MCLLYGLFLLPYSIIPFILYKDYIVTVPLNILIIWLVSLVIFFITMLLRNSFNMTTVPLNGININLPPATESDIDMLSANVLNASLVLVTASVRPVLSDMVLKMVDSEDTLSDVDILSAMLLNMVPSLVTESDVDIDSVTALTEPYNLDTLSDSDTDGSVIVFLFMSLLANASVISLVFCAVSNTAGSNMVKSKSLPLSNSLLITVGVMYVTTSVTEFDSVSVLNTPSMPVILSDMDMDGPVMLLKLAMTLANTSPIELDSVNALCDASNLPAESVVSITPPGLVSNIAASNTASSNTCLDSSSVTR